jgi:hypothetical protein
MVLAVDWDDREKEKPEWDSLLLDLSSSSKIFFWDLFLANMMVEDFS